MLPPPQTVEVRHESGVGEARRAAKAVAAALGFSPNACEEIALAMTELATNLIKHAAGGTLTLTPLAERRARRVGDRVARRWPGHRRRRAGPRRPFLDGRHPRHGPGSGQPPDGRTGHRLRARSRHAHRVPPMAPRAPGQRRGLPAGLRRGDAAAPAGPGQRRCLRRQAMGREPAGRASSTASATASSPTAPPVPRSSTWRTISTCRWTRSFAAWAAPAARPAAW